MRRLGGKGQASGSAAIGAVEINAGAEVALVIVADEDYAIEWTMSVHSWFLAPPEAKRHETDGDKATDGSKEEVTSVHHLASAA